MKILGISCSLRKVSNTSILIKEALTAAKKEGAETEFMSLIGKNIKPCEGCLTCTKTGKCRIKDDMKDIYDKMIAADGIIIGSPIFSWSVAGQTKVLIDRMFMLKHPHLKLSNKVGGVIVVASRLGLMNGATVINMCFHGHHMISTDMVGALARTAGAVRKDKYAIQGAHELGRQMSSLITAGFKFPEGYNQGFVGHLENGYPVKSSPFE